MDCFTKTTTLQGPRGRKIVFKGERNDISNYIVSAITTRKMIKKGLRGLPCLVLETKKGDIQLSNIPIVKEFPDVFLDKLSGVPPKREVEVTIDVLPDTSLIA